jgi:hypothetical protein
VVATSRSTARRRRRALTAKFPDRSIIFIGDRRYRERKSILDP